MTEPNGNVERIIPKKNRNKHRSCIFAIMGLWFGLLGLIVVVMVLVREKIVHREPEQIQAKAGEFAEFQVPGAFKPYSMTDFFGKTVLSYWDSQHVRSDGRTLAVIALFSDKSWNRQSLPGLEQSFLKEAEERLKENEFLVLASEIVAWDLDGQPFHFQVFSGRQRIGDQLVDATSCYRFFSSAKGNFQMSTLGVETAFNKADQIAFLKSVVPKQED